MSLEELPQIISHLPDEHPVNAFAQQSTLMKLPNELLTYIVEFIGPPDISCCDPGWLVVPAICHRLREVVERLDGWKSETTLVQDSALEYGWVTDSRHRRRQILAAGTPARVFYVDLEDEERYMHWRFTPTYKAGSVDYLAASLTVEQDIRQTIDRYLAGSQLQLNLRWMTSISLAYYRQDDHSNADSKGFSFANVPCIVAPALQELRLNDYIVDWRCDGLESLTIRMSENSGYHYPLSQLLARLNDSRLTLEQVYLEHCLPTVFEHTSGGELVTTVDFPCLRTFNVEDMPHAVGWLCRRIGFPTEYPPMITGSGSGILFLRSLACEYSNSTPNTESAIHSRYGELDTLTFRRSTRCEELGCFVTASRITPLARPWRSPDRENSLEMYAQYCTARYSDYDYDQDVRELEGVAPGIEPAFIVDLGWTLDGWKSMPSVDDALCAERSVLHGIRNVFVDGLEHELLNSASEESAQVWEAALRYLPNVRSLYIHTPSPASLAPLVKDPGLLPALGHLWLGCYIEDEAPRCKVDAKVLLSVIEQRRKMCGKMTSVFGVQLVNVQLVGDAQDVQKVMDCFEVESSNLGPPAQD